MEHVKLESLVDTVDFWSDPYTISQYVNSLVASCGKSDVVSIKVENYSSQPRVTFGQTYVKNQQVPHYTVYLPKIKDFYFDEETKKHDIKLRKAFLKHEVAHIIFSEMDSYKLHKLNCTGEEFLLNNALEDVRIEHKFGQRFHGANDAFFEVQESFYKQAKTKIEQSKLSLFNLALYIMYRSKKFNFESTSSVVVYERYYQKYKDFLNLSQLELSNLTKQIKTEFETEFFVQSQSNNNSEDSGNSNETEDSESNTNKDYSESDETKNFENDTTEDSDDDEKSEQENSSNTKSNSGGDSSSEDSDDDEKSEQENSKGNSNKQEDNWQKDFSDQLAEQMQDNSKKENEEYEKVKKESKSKTNEVDENGNVKVFSLSALSPDEVRELLEDDTLNDFVRYDNSTMKTHGSEVVDISQYAALVSKRINFSHSTESSRRKVYLSYDKVVSKNRKNINSLVNYFKLKFQQKEKSLKSFNKEDGLLNNESLYKLFKSDSDKKIFYTVEKSLVTKSDVSFLLDFSGSMSGSRIRNLVQTLIVLNEVFTKLEVPFNVFSFSGKGGYTSLYYKTKNEKTVLKKAFSSTKTLELCNEGETYVTFKSKYELQKEITYCWISRQTKANDRKKVLSLLNKSVNEKYNSTEFNKNWHNAFFGGSTPEVQSVIALYNKLPSQKLFLINDGSYDQVSLNSYEKQEVAEALNKKSYMNCARAFLNLLEGKKLTFYTEKQLDTFKNEVVSASDDLLNNYSSTYDITLLGSASIERESRQLLSSLLYNFQSNKSRSFTVTGSCGTATQTYVQSKDCYELVFNLKKLEKPLVLLKNTYTEKTFDSYSDENEQVVTLHFEKSVVETYADFFRYKVYSGYHSGKVNFKVSKNKSSEYTYRSLFQKMRNEGWSVWGIGIESWSASSYLGKENFSSVQGSKDLQENLEKRVKSVV